MAARASAAAAPAAPRPRPRPWPCSSCCCHRTNLQLRQPRRRRPPAPAAPPSALPDTAAAASVIAIGVGVGVAATVLLGRTSSSSSRSEEQEEEECEDCGGTGICSRCKGEGFVFKELPDETANKARKAAKSMATRYTAGLPTKWTYCNKCSSARTCPTCRGSGRRHDHNNQPSPPTDKSDSYSS